MAPNEFHLGNFDRTSSCRFLVSSLSSFNRTNGESNRRKQLRKILHHRASQAFVVHLRIEFGIMQPPSRSSLLLISACLVGSPLTNYHFTVQSPIICASLDARKCTCTYWIRVGKTKVGSVKVFHGWAKTSFPRGDNSPGVVLQDYGRGR